RRNREAQRRGKSFASGQRLLGADRNVIFGDPVISGQKRNPRRALHGGDFFCAQKKNAAPRGTALNQCVKPSDDDLTPNRYKTKIKPTIDCNSILKSAKNEGELTERRSKI
ncbi:MAG: hypothetical protein ACO3CI_07645, partial [Schleiferiaceae bacterium]